jgi:hypothetical protein
LDLSGFKEMAVHEIPTARERGGISPDFRQKILNALANPIRTLPDVQRQRALAALR